MNYLRQELKDALQYDLDNCPDLNLEKDLVNTRDVLKAHYILADYFTDESSGEIIEKMLVGVRSYGLLASALARQSVEFGGKKKYTEKIDICATLFFGLIKNHAFHDGNKRTALLILIYQLQKYGYYPQPKNGFHDFEKLAVAVADNRVEKKYSNVWKKFKKQDDVEIKTISYVLRRMVEKKDRSFHMDITTKKFCDMLETAGVKCVLDGQKLKFSRRIKGFIGSKTLTYTVNFYGWTRPVQAAMVRDTAKELSLLDEYPSFSSWADADSNIYKIICDFEIPLRRLKDK